MKATPPIRTRPSTPRAFAIGLTMWLAAGFGFAQEGEATESAGEAPAPMPASKAVAPIPKDLDEAKRMAVASYAQIAEANYKDALTEAIEMRKDVQALIAAPTVFHHLSAKLGWLEARMPYLQSEAFRFSGGPVDELAGLLNAWPLNAVYVDYVEGKPTAGIIGDADTYPKLNPEVLAALNAAGGAENVSTGYHAIEFLLWGQDQSPTSAGPRTHEDYKAEIDKNAGRRSLYLKACADLLVRHLSELHSQWVPGKDNYRAQFEKLPPDEALKKVLTGPSALAGLELARKGLGAAYENKDQRQEQSKFSDTTHVDLLHNTAGIANLVAGAYIGVDGSVKVLGVGLAAVADQVSKQRGESLRAATNAAMKAANGIKAPFDQEILEENVEGRKRVKALIDALETLAAEVNGLAGELGLGAE